MSTEWRDRMAFAADIRGLPSLNGGDAHQSSDTDSVAILGRARKSIAESTVMDSYGGCLFQCAGLSSDTELLWCDCKFGAYRTGCAPVPGCVGGDSHASRYGYEVLVLRYREGQNFGCSTPDVPAIARPS